MTEPSDADVSVSYHRGRKDHFLEDGETLCRFGPVSGGEEKHVSELSDREVKLLATSNNTCTYCARYAKRRGILPRRPDDVPQFECTECGKPAMRIEKIAGMLFAKHADGTAHDIDPEAYEQWRRGGT